MMRRAPAVVALLLLWSSAVEGEPHPFRGEATVKADKLKVDHDKRRAEFEGHVRALYGSLTLTCDKMVITYADGGGVSALQATGNVMVIKEGSRATARSATLQAFEGLLVLEGDPVLVMGAHRLEGRRIVAHLRSGTLDIEEARGTFYFKEERSR